MKFPQIPVHDLEGATLNFEQLQLRSILDKTPQNFLQLLTAGTLAIVTGTVTFTFTAAVVSGSQTVTHGIGRTPQVWLQSQNNLLATAVTAKTTTTFTANGFVTNNVAGTATVTMDWLAIG